MLGQAVQARLLRAIDAREVVPVGAATGARLELGIVAASHRELRTAVVERRFSGELYQRLARATVHLPPLRERKIDLARLVQREVSAAGGPLAPHPKLVEACCLRPWPGNIRELRTAVRRAAGAALAAGRTIVRFDDLDPRDGLLAEAATAETAVNRPMPPPQLDKDAVIAALGRANGVVSVAARNLGLHRTQLRQLMEKHGIARDD
jgi:transcriptional regulator of acetoin/glycerol metabolism